jgi:GNAT superfamily N-acetyltransferase
MLPPRHADIHRDMHDDVRIRPLFACDSSALHDFYTHLSPEAVYARFFVDHIGDPEARGLTDPVDQRDHLAVVAERVTGNGAAILGVARVVRFDADADAGEVGIVVADQWRRRGIGEALLRSLALASWRVGILDWTVLRLPQNDNVDRLVQRVAALSNASESSGIVESRYRLLPAGVAVNR